MGDARRRGNYETRKTLAILAGRAKQAKRKAKATPSTKTLFSALLAMLDVRKAPKAEAAK